MPGHSRPVWWSTSTLFRPCVSAAVRHPYVSYCVSEATSNTITCVLWRAASVQGPPLFEVNVIGVQRLMRATLPTLRAQRDGLVVNIGSILGRVTFPYLGLYGASKYALEALTDSYRYELSQLGIDVVLVQPSAYPTNMYGSAQQPADKVRAEVYGEI